MHARSIPHPSILSLAALVAGLMLCSASCGRTQGAAPAAQSSAGLFPDPEPVLVEKASLRNLLDALQRKDGDAARSMIWQLLAAMFKARDAGTGPSEFLAAGYRAEQLKGSDAADVQNCLLSAWAGAQSLALFTPENIALMERGAAPRATRGVERGVTVNLDMEKLPAVALTTKAPARKVSPATAEPPAPLPLPVSEPAATPSPYVIKTLEAILHEKVPLDAYGLRNMDLRLDSVDPRGSVAFLFDDRTIHRPAFEGLVNPLNQRKGKITLPDPVNRTTLFALQSIPETKLRGVKLLTLPFASIYLEEDLGVGLTFHLVIRVASEALMLDQLPPERRKLYEIPLNP